MIKFFIATIFIAELIIASSIILNIYRINRQVNNLNDSVFKYKSRIAKDFRCFKFLLKIFKNKIYKFKAIVKRKNEEYLLKIIKTTLIYGSFFALKGKYKKIILAYQIGKEIFEGIQEA